MYIEKEHDTRSYVNQSLYFDKQYCICKQYLFLQVRREHYAAHYYI